MQSKNKPLIIIVGATAVGKTALSLQLAEKYQAEIVSADSRLVYRGMDIGTAKPSRAEQAYVPHHLIDTINPDESWSLSDFQLASHQAIHDIHQRGKLPILVGGTGQYIKAILEHWELPKQPPHYALRSFLELWGKQQGYQALHHRLSLLDPQAAQSIDPTNMRRTIRAIEVIFQSGRRFSEQRKKRQPIFRNLIFGLHRPRTELYQRIDNRIQSMLDNGFIEEVQNLLSIGYSPYLPSMSAIGYQQIAAYLQGNITLDEAVLLIKRLTRVFVRRQANWFKLDDPQINWIILGDQTEIANTHAIQLQIEPFLYDIHQS